MQTASKKFKKEDLNEAMKVAHKMLGDGEVDQGKGWTEESAKAKPALRRKPTTPMELLQYLGLAYRNSM